MSFTESEFYCKCGCGLGFSDINQDAFSALKIARSYSKVPFIINSSIRCPDRNKTEGGSPTSSHLRGLAFDIKCKTSYDRIRIITAVLNSPFTRVGVAKNFIHVDLDPDKQQYLMWVYQ